MMYVSTTQHVSIPHLVTSRVRVQKAGKPKHARKVRHVLPMSLSYISDINDKLK